MLRSIREALGDSHESSPDLVRADRQERYHAAMTGLSHANLQRIPLEEHAALATPIDFADLERGGILTRATRGWFVLLQPKALPAYAWKQVTTVRAGTHAMPMVRFNEADDA
jgi:hypothetical protein